jgi:hypothetical protein
MSHRLSTWVWVVICAALAWAGAQFAFAASCTTQAQMDAAQRDTLAKLAHSLLSDIQSGNVQALQQNSIPELAANFGAVTSSVEHLKPLIQTATITVDNLYLLDASDNPSQPAATDFYCGSPVVSLHFASLPKGTYALAILHATGVKDPQQFSLVLSQAAGARWLLGGFFEKPMMSAGHDGLWYWENARHYAQTKSGWSAWLYYQTAANLLDPLNFLSSPNLQKLHQEADQVRPSNFPGAKPLTLSVSGATYALNAVSTTTEFGALDLDVRYAPTAAEAAQLSNPPQARQQVTEIMAALVELHPGLKLAFHGIWLQAQQGSSSLFALELPMAQITSAPAPQASESMPVNQ